MMENILKWFFALTLLAIGSTLTIFGALNMNLGLMVFAFFALLIGGLLLTDKEQ